jgi:uncharacterized protein (TIGR03435 family)
MRQAVPILAVLLLAIVGRQNTRAQTPTLTFEVASIKKISEAAMISRSQGARPNGSFEAAGTLVRFVMSAFDVADFEVIGGPNWIRTDRFLISARAGREASATEINLMLQALLAERFGLRTHVDLREMTQYVLRRPGRYFNLMNESALLAFIGMTSCLPSGS